MPNQFHLVLWPHADGDMSWWMHSGEGWQFIFLLHPGLVSTGEHRSSAPRPSAIRAISSIGITGRASWNKLEGTCAIVESMNDSVREPVPRFF